MVKKVLHVFGQMSCGGAETMMMNLYRRIDTDRWHFDFMVHNREPGFYDEEIRQRGGNIFYLPSMGEAGLPAYIRELRHFLEEHPYDVVHSHMDFHGGAVAKAAAKAGIPCRVVHSHAVQTMFARDLPHKLLIALSKRMINRYATAQCACSMQAGASLFRNNDRTVIIKNAIDLPRFLHPDEARVAALRAQFHLEEDTPVLGHIGSFPANKNQALLIEVLRRMLPQQPRARLLLIGDGQRRKALQQQVAEMGLSERITFTGEQADIPELLSLLDVFLFPSHVEGLGMVAIEAQAVGLPCVVSDTLLKELDMGLSLVRWADIGNPDAWVNTIREAAGKRLTDTEQVERQLRANGYDLADAVKRLEEVYEGCE